MTDRELLELAAKAAGVEVHRGNGWQSDSLFRRIKHADGLFTAIEWNPLTDDGDALRLAVRLRMTVCVDNSMTDVEDCAEAHIGDSYSATRRAIVRAAAEIGRAK